MPISNSQQPSVAVAVPVPQPAPTKQKKPPVAPQPPLKPAPPRLSAILMPWTPSRKKMSRGVLQRQRSVEAERFNQLVEGQQQGE